MREVCHMYLIFTPGGVCDVKYQISGPNTEECHFLGSCIVSDREEFGRLKKTLLLVWGYSFCLW